MLHKKKDFPYLIKLVLDKIWKQMIATEHYTFLPSEANRTAPLPPLLHEECDLK